VDAQIGGDVLAGTAPVGHQHDLQAVTQCAMLGRTEQRLKTFRLGRG
jgi:hypothetical protein